MVLPLRPGARSRWSPRRITVVALALTLLAVACTREDRPLTEGNAGGADHEGDAGAASAGSDHRGEAGAGASGGSDHRGEAGAGAGGVAGHEDSPSQGGAGEGGMGGEPGGGTSSSGGTGPAGGEAGSGAGGEGGTETEPDAPSGLPCEVETVLRERCQNCHSRTPASPSIVPLMTYANLTAQSKVDPSLTVAARSLKRIKDSEFPMPPAPVSPATSEEIAVLEAWIGAGKPPGSCDPRGEPTDPYDAPPVCSSDNYWTGGTSGSPWMMPGRACIACHKTTNNHAPRFAVAGTVFPTAHEPDKCYGVPATAGAMVIITDANGVEQPPIPVTGGGNFNARWTTLAVPYRAKVVVGDREHVMLTPQTSGDCNACHTQNGAEGARGRIILP